MAFFDKKIQFRNSQASTNSDYHFQIYKTSDDDNMYVIELYDESNLKFIYRIRLTARNEEKICNENGIIPENGLTKYIQQFVNELSDKQWLTCEVSNEKQCNIHFYEFVKNLGGKLILKLSLLVVENAEFQQYVIDTAEKYKRRYIDKKRENEGQRKKLESYEKKIEEMKSDIDEKYKLSKELKDMREERERLDFKYERLEADFERQKEEIADLFEAKQELQNDYAELEKRYKEAVDKAAELAALRDQALEKNEVLESQQRQESLQGHVSRRSHRFASNPNNQNTNNNAVDSDASMETDREDNNVNSDEELDESLTFKYRKNKVVRHMRKFTVIDTRKKSRAIRCLYCRALLHSAISRHYNPKHSTCYRKFTTLADAAEKTSQLWRANVIDEAIITSAKIRSLLASTNNNAKIVAGYLDGSIVFGHYVQAVYATEFNAIRAEMKNL